MQLSQECHIIVTHARTSTRTNAIRSASHVHCVRSSVLDLRGDHQSVSCEHPGTVMGFEQRNSRSHNQRHLG